ncbi:MAG: GAF domain-containing SpoIIE family protein phosphatase [Acidobacteriota bacterium]
MNFEKDLACELIELYSELELESLLDKIADKIKIHLNCEESSIFLYNQEKEELYFETATGDKEEELKKIVIKKGEGIAGWIAETQQTIVVNDCSKEDRFKKTFDKKTNFKTSSILGCPVKTGNILIGVVEAINKKDGDFSKKDEEMLDYFSSFISIPLQNAILFKKVIRESKEKGQLIELGKTVSSSFTFDEVFKTLKEIISEIIPVKEITIMVNSQQRVYHLIGSHDPEENENSSETIINNKSAIFPLRTEDKTLGFLQVESEKYITGQTISLLKGLAIFTAISINKYEMYKDLIEKEKIEKELQIARDIQQSFLLNEKIDLKNIDFSFINLPSSKVGGDYYDIVKLNRNESVFTLNDISGHGIPASLLMSIVRTNFVYRIKRDKDIQKTIGYLNNLIAETTEPNLYVTSFTCLIDSEKKTLDYLNCGHTPSLLVRGKKQIEISEGDTVLGMFPGVEFNLRSMDLKKNDIIVLYTDGVVEAENEKEEQFSFERLKQIVTQNSSSDTEKIKDIIITELKEFVKKESFTDDITFIVIKIT